MTAAWYLMRATGVVSLVLLTVVFALGIATTNRWRVGRSPAFVTPAVHRSLALLSVVFVAIHVVTAVVDPYAAVSVVSVAVPFASSWKPVWVGLGALSLDLVVALIVSSLLRRRIGLRAWRAIHWLAYLSWPVALAHSLGTGTDVGTLWLQVVAGGCAFALGLALVWRIALRRPGKHLEPRRAPRPELARAAAPRRERTAA